MYQGRRRGSLSRALGKGADSELESLNKQLNVRQEKIAELELELFDTRASMHGFVVEMESRVGPIQIRIARLQVQVEEARRQSAYNAQWKDRADAPEYRNDVQEQYRRAWTPGIKKPAPYIITPRKEEDVQPLKNFYRQLAKRFHPDLTTDIKEKEIRQVVMAEVNAAYAAADLAALEKIAAQPERLVGETTHSRTQLILELHREIERLDQLILNLEQEVTDLYNSEQLQLTMQANLAAHDGRDLIQELVAEYQLEFEQLQQELARLT